MARFIQKITSVLIWVMVVAIVVVAIITTTLRVLLPNLNYFSDDIYATVKQHTGLNLEIGNISGLWSNTSQFLHIKDVTLNLSGDQSVNLTMDDLHLEIDIVQSIFKARPVIKDLLVNKLSFDIGNLDLLAKSINLPYTKFITDLKNKFHITSGSLNFDSGISFDRHGQANELQIQVKPSYLRGQNNEQLQLSGGSIQVILDHNEQFEIKAFSHNLKVVTNDHKWENFKFKFNWSIHEWLLNINKLDIVTLTPFLPIIDDFNDISGIISESDPQGSIEDLRINMKNELSAFNYSFKINDLKLQQLDTLQQFGDLDATVMGTDQCANIYLASDKLVIDGAFSQPVQIQNAKIDLVWQQNDVGMSIWAQDIQLQNSDLNIVGQFKLDLPYLQNPFLSLYIETDLHDAGQVWRYLPTEVLDDELRIYLSDAILAGEAKTAQILWFGELNKFPYMQHEGIFQALVKLKETQFQFDPAWPALTKLQLDLLFENDNLYFTSHTANLHDIKAQYIEAKIAPLAENSRLELTAKVSGQSKQVKKYMNATPLNDSVGNTLEYLQLSGDVSSTFHLDIPFAADQNTRAWGRVDLVNNTIDIQEPMINLSQVNGSLYFDDDKIQGNNFDGLIYGQPIKIKFSGEDTQEQYEVKIAIKGNWEFASLKPHIPDNLNSDILSNALKHKITGILPWDLNATINLEYAKDLNEQNTTGFNYKIQASSSLEQMQLDFPYPFNSQLFPSEQKVWLDLLGNQEQIIASLQAPLIKYQTKISLLDSVKIAASNLIIGSGGFKINLIDEKIMSIQLDKLDVQTWIKFIDELSTLNIASQDHNQLASNTDINQPSLFSQLDVAIKILTFGDITFNDVNLTARNVDNKWLIEIQSQQIKGELTYTKNLQPKLKISLDKLYLHLPILEQLRMGLAEQKDVVGQNKFLQQLHDFFPDLTVQINDFWLQGYKIGSFALDISKDHKTHSLMLNKAIIKSDVMQIDLSGNWQFIAQKVNRTNLNISLKGDNNSALLEHFNLNSNIHGATFEVKSDLTWENSPWNFNTKSLHGIVSTKLGRGNISQVNSNGAKILGLFSFDSIIRRMQLDFTGIFDDGLAFNAITGTGNLKSGVLATNDIVIDTVAGGMKIQGIIDLNKKQVDAVANFIPDVTSGLPVLTAFAVAPHVGIYVLAVSKLISPVIEVFTQVNYSVIGPIDAPIVKELSRSSAELMIPKYLN